MCMENPLVFSSNLIYTLLCFILTLFFGGMIVQKILSNVRRCVEDYEMIKEGDRIAVGVSGGKDSVLLLYAMAKLKEFYPIPFDLHAITVHPGNPEMDFTPIAQLCEELQVPYHLVHTEIFQIVFEWRKEKNPCSMCSKMRRGVIHSTMKDLDLNKIALGHHFDDAVETFLLSLLYEGRISCFQPVTDLSRSGITQVRPLLYCGEGMIRNTALRYHLPIIQNVCPANGNTKRQEIKDLIVSLSSDYPKMKDYIFGSMQRLPLPGWEVHEHRRCPDPNKKPNTKI